MDGEQQVNRAIAAWATRAQPPADAARRNLRAIERRLAAARTRQQHERERQARRRLWRGVAIAAAVAAIGVLALTSIRGRVVQERPSEASDAALDQVHEGTTRHQLEDRSRPIGPQPPPEPPQPPPDAQPEPRASLPNPESKLTPAPSRPGSAEAPPVVPAADRLRIEITLMERARMAMDSGDNGGALRLLATHATEFADGVMREEHNAWVAICSCRLGLAAGQHLATEFAREFPGSALGERVVAACTQNRETDSRP